MPTLGQLQDRRTGDRRRMSEPVTTKVFVGALTMLVGTFLLWLFATGAESVTSAQRFERDSLRRDFNDSLMRRDMSDVKATGLRTDSTTRCILAKLDQRPSPFCP